MGEQRQIVFRGKGDVAFEAFEPERKPLAADEIEGRTLFTTISPGTELAVLQGARNASYPLVPGYAAVLEVTAVGEHVSTLHVGDIVFAMAGHRSQHRLPAAEALPLPPGLKPEAAGLVRLLGVGLSTLVTTQARPPDIVLVFGLGIVGLMAAQAFQLAGYEVWAVEPDARRRALASRCGLSHVLATSPPPDDPLAGQVALVLECAGHEEAALAGLRLVRKRGEVVLVGVPWRSHAPERTAHEILEAVFHQYAVLRSGWEWELPRHPTDFRVGSIFDNLRAGLRWLAEGKIRTEGLYALYPAAEAPAAYEALRKRELEALTVVFDWRNITL